MALVMLLLLAGCASKPSYPFRWYAVDYALDSLRGPTPDDDLPLQETCGPVRTQIHRCIVYKLDEHLRLKDAFERQQIRIEELERLR